MKKLILLLLLVCTCATLSWAQSGKRITVTGSVIDGDDKSPGWTSYRTITFSTR